MYGWCCLSRFERGEAALAQQFARPARQLAFFEWCKPTIAEDRWWPPASPATVRCVTPRAARATSFTIARVAALSDAGRDPGQIAGLIEDCRDNCPQSGPRMRAPTRSQPPPWELQVCRAGKGHHQAIDHASRQAGGGTGINRQRALNARSALGQCGEAASEPRKHAARLALDTPVEFKKKERRSNPGSRHGKIADQLVLGQRGGAEPV